LPFFRKQGKEEGMIQRVNFLFARIICVCALLLFLPALHSADNNSTNGAGKKDAASLINSMKLKKLSKDLELREDQQKKVQVLFDEEAKLIAKVQQDQNLSFVDRRSKTDQIHQETYGKMKPLLTPPQLEKFEKAMSDAKAPKKKKK
jgi:Spy/CpxP family protein refolding chaperone